MNGDSAASMGAPDNISDAATFSTFSGDAGFDSLNSALSGTMTMEEVHSAFQARTDGRTTDPEVWAWIGISGTRAGSYASTT